MICSRRIAIAKHPFRGIRHLPPFAAGFGDCFALLCFVPRNSSQLLAMTAGASLVDSRIDREHGLHHPCSFPFVSLFSANRRIRRQAAGAVYYSPATFASSAQIINTKTPRHEASFCLVFVPLRLCAFVFRSWLRLGRVMASSRVSVPAAH